jgi:hypothetical protein
MMCLLKLRSSVTCREQVNPQVSTGALESGL